MEELLHQLSNSIVNILDTENIKIQYKWDGICIVIS